MSTQPFALVVEDTPVHATLAEVNLQETGFAPAVVGTLLDGWRWAIDHLDREQRGPACGQRGGLVLLDMKLPDPHHPQLEGTVLATWLSDEMIAGRLQPAHIVGISSELTPEREWAALAAGCTTILAKPITPIKARLLKALLDEPAPILSDDVATRAFRQSQRDVMALIVRAHRSTRLWSGGEARALLGVMTASLHLAPEERERGAALVAELGGMTATRLRLRTLLPRLDQEQGRLLTLLIQNVAQQHIAGRFGVGRRKLEGQIERLLEEIALALSSG